MALLNRLIDDLLGNTQIMKNVRQVTKSVNPKNHAIWTLEELWIALSTFCFEVYDTLPHTTLGMSPRDSFNLGIANTGSRSMKYIAYDDNSRIMTLPTTSRREALIQPTRGVKINYLYYWNTEFYNSRVSGTKVPIRYDPYNMGHAYVYANGQWIRCLSEYHDVFRDRTEREITIAVEEIKQKKRLMNREVYLSAKVIADFITSLEGQEILQKQRLKDRAMHNKLSPSCANR